MKLPICYFCARTKVLCRSDLQRLESGEISELDVDIAHELVLLREKRYHDLDNIEFVGAMKIGNMTILIARGLDKVSRTTLIKVSRHLEERGFGRIRFVEGEQDVRSIVEQVVSPSRVLGVNILWLPDGSSEYTVRIPKVDSRKMPVRKEIAEEILERILGQYVRIIFV